jgi:hypothetical protein
MMMMKIILVLKTIQNSEFSTKLYSFTNFQT